MATSAPTSLSHARDGTGVALPFAAVVLAMLPAVLDQTMLSTGLPVIAGDLGRLSDVSWVVTAYVVAAAATTPFWGKLGDRDAIEAPLGEQAPRRVGDELPRAQLLALPQAQVRLHRPIHHRRSVSHQRWLTTNLIVARKIK